jgi:hypothetical protein
MSHVPKEVKVERSKSIEIVVMSLFQSVNLDAPGSRKPVSERTRWETE